MEFNISLDDLNEIIETRLRQQTAFTPEVVEQLAQEFDIPKALHDIVGNILILGAAQWAYEMRRAARDFKQIRKDLTGLEKVAVEIARALENLSAETRDVLVEAGFGRTRGGCHYPYISVHDSLPVMEYEPSSGQDSSQISLTEIASILSSLSKCVADAQPTARAGRKGKIDDESMYDLLHSCFHVWESILGRKFSLDWASNGEPITDAAVFCVRVARLVDPALSLQKIATASRKTREKGMKISDLEKTPEVLEHYRKQFE
ncbi:hypothetical protein [Nioella ostreopsis]|uniref:hypothetical protein n=1 Tax=Nioella ostreopsis TaxID=2448479 RepID=UPI000FD76512|nr:hypothetical protein [Nioella ostreopsis]